MLSWLLIGGQKKVKTKQKTEKKGREAMIVVFVPLHNTF